MENLEINQIYNTDTIQGMRRIVPESIDLIFCDLPYGITARNKWDSEIPPQKLWEQYERIIKPNGAIVLFGSGMFAAKMILSNPTLYRYSLVWQKTTPTGFLNAKKMPLRIHEDIMVFYKKPPTYNPQKTFGHKPVHSYTKHTSDGNNYNETKRGITGGGSTERYPTSVLTFATDKQKSSIHNTQKPLELCRYIVRTYSNEGEVVLDNCCGSGTIPLAAKIEGRSYIGIDNGVCENPKSNYNMWYWADVSRDRIKLWTT